MSINYKSIIDLFITWQMHNVSKGELISFLNALDPRTRLKFYSIVEADVHLNEAWKNFIEH